MKYSSRVFAPIVSLLVVTFAADSAFAGAPKTPVGMTTGGGSKGYGVTDQPSTNCPTGQTWDATAKKCVAPTDFSKGMQVHPYGGAANATPLNNRSNLGGAADATPLNNRSNLGGSAQQAPTGAPSTGTPSTPTH